MRTRLGTILFLLAVGVVLSSLVRSKNSHAQSAALAKEPVDAALGGGKWQPIFEGIDRVELHTKKPRLLKGQALRIDLDAKGIEFLASPGTGGPLSGKAEGHKTSVFLAKNKCQAAINAAPFSPVHVEEGKPQDIIGLQVSKGEIVAKERSGFGALLITKDNKATIGYPPFDLKDVYNAVGGFQVAMKKGEVVKIGKDDKHPRSAVGVSGDGKTLYLLVIDGRQAGFSEGVTQEEMADWLKLLGASEGLNLDGGGSTALVIEGVDNKPKILNRPINNPLFPGTERVSASHLGVMAKLLAK